MFLIWLAGNGNDCWEKFKGVFKTTINYKTHQSTFFKDPCNCQFYLVFLLSRQSALPVETRVFRLLEQRNIVAPDVIAFVWEPLDGFMGLIWSTNATLLVGNVINFILKNIFTFPKSTHAIHSMFHFFPPPPSYINIPAPSVFITMNHESSKMEAIF